MQFRRTVARPAFAVAGFHYGDSKLILWPDQTPDAVIARIDKEWDPAKGDPKGEAKPAAAAVLPAVENRRAIPETGN